MHPARRAAAWGLALALLLPAPAWAQGAAAAALARLNGELVIAAYKGDRLAVASALGRGAQLSAADANGYTPLHWAAYGGHTALAGDLLARGAPVEARTRVGQSPLMLAAWQGHSEVVELLLARGAEVGATSPQGHSAEAYARRKGHLALAERLAQAALPPKNQASGHWCLFGPRPAHQAAAPQAPRPGANGGWTAAAQATPSPRPSLAPSWSAREALAAAPTPTPGPQATPWAIAPRPSLAPGLPPSSPSPRPAAASPSPLAAWPSARPSSPPPASASPWPSPEPVGPSPWAWWLAGEEGAPAWALGPSLGVHVSGLSFPIAGGQLRRGLTQQLALRAAYEQGGYQQPLAGANVAYQFQRYHLALLSQGRLYGGVGVVHVVLGNAWDGGNHPSITAAELIGGLRWPLTAYGVGLEPWGEFRFGLEGPSTANLGLAWRF